MSRPARINLKTQPHHLLGLSALVMAAVSLLPSSTGAMDMNVHDTYVVVSSLNFWMLTSDFLLFLWAVYTVFTRFVASVKLVWAHVALTLFVIVFFIFSDGLIGILDPPRNNYAFNNHQPSLVVIEYGTAVILFSIGQLLLLINLATGLAKASSNPK